MAQKLIEQLESSGNYKVIERLPLVEQYHEPGAGVELLKGAYVDVETTGLSHENDKVIELAIVPFEFDKEGRIYKVGEAFDQFQDPGVPISEEITRLTSITNEMVAGKSIDVAAVESVLAGVSLVVAHNADFDRPFCEGVSDAFKDLHWACSINDVNWGEEGVESPKLVFLAYKFGFFYDAHRANVDCLAGIHLLSKILPLSNIPVLKKLLANARKTNYRIDAIGAPFEKKDLLKERGYRWNPGDAKSQKCWYRNVPDDVYESELVYLEKSIYGKDIGHLPIEKITAKTRYRK
ncbi:MAG: DNA polymerase III subunit epsilon [Pseudomonadales bacterium]|nr:DNA polymerase III subunit epsilon [Pseudomonadales bacterium]